VGQKVEQDLRAPARGITTARSAPATAETVLHYKPIRAWPGRSAASPISPVKIGEDANPWFTAVSISAWDADGGTLAGMSR